jgi:chorismatase
LNDPIDIVTTEHISCHKSRDLAENQPGFAFAFPLLHHPFGIPIASFTPAEAAFETWQIPGSPEILALPDGFILKYPDYSFGMLSFQDSDTQLTESTRQAYDRLFDALKSNGTPYPCRLWNFMPRINEDDAHGLERYRAFCAGRAQAFFDDIQAEEGFLPAGTGVGCEGDRIWIVFLASRKKMAVHMENPRQMPAYHYPPQYGPKSPSFARATYLPVTTDNGLLMISGTASIIGHKSQHEDDVVAQTQTTFDNIAQLIATPNCARYDVPQGLNLQHLSAVRVYIRHAEDLNAIRQVVLTRLGSLDQVSFLQADICRRELLVEIEGIIPIP